MEREHGRIVSVSTRTLGSSLEGDTPAGATELVVFDAADFDESGGTLSINGAKLAYSTYDDDTATIALTDPLPAPGASDGDFVAAWDTLYDRASTVQTAMVQLDGDDDNPDPIEAFVPHFLADKLDDGDRGGPGETVVIGYEEEDDEWHVLDVLGLADASGAGVKFCNTDTFTVTAAGAQTIALSHTPLPESLDVTWKPDGLGGVPMDSSEWSVDGSTLTVPDPGYFTAGDKIDPQYAYRDGPITPTVTTPPSVAGWAAIDNNSIFTSLPLPTGTAIGDLILFAGANAPTVTDSRLTHVTGDDSNGLYIGTATTLDDLQISGGNANRAAYGIATFHSAQALSTQVIKGTTSLSIPAISPATGVALIALSGGSGTLGSIGFGPEYTSLGVSPDDFTNVACSYWIDPNGTASPTTTATSTIGNPTTWVLVVRMA